MSRVKPKKMVLASIVTHALHFCTFVGGTFYRNFKNRDCNVDGHDVNVILY